MIAIPLILVFLLVSFLGFYRWRWGYADEWAGVFLIAGIIFLVSVITIPLGRVDQYGDIAAHQEIGATLERARANDFDGFERATIQRRVIATNAELRRRQMKVRYWWPYIPAAMLEVEPVE